MKSGHENSTGVVTTIGPNQPTRTFPFIVDKFVKGQKLVKPLPHQQKLTQTIARHQVGTVDSLWCS